MPSFMNGKRSRLITIATAGTLAVAAVASAAAVTLSSGPAPSGAADDSLLVLNRQQVVQANTVNSAQEMAQFAQLRSELNAAQAAAAKAAEAKAAADKAAADKAAAAKAAAAKAAAAKAAAAKQAAQQKAQHAAALSGSPQQVAQQMLGQFGWSASQFSCVQPLWEHESRWSISASNPSSGAYGIPQALPGSRMASAGPDWQTNAATQIRWGLQYIKGTYGSPCAAWSHEESAGWY